MVEIRLSEVARIQRILVDLRDPQVTLDTVAEQVAEVPPLVRRLEEEVHKAVGRPSGQVRQAVALLGLEEVRRQIKDLLERWIVAVERPGGAKIVGDPARYTPVPMAEVA